MQTATEQRNYTFRASGNPMLNLLGFGHLLETLDQRDRLVIAIDGRPAAQHQHAKPGTFETMYRLDKNMHTTGPAFSLCYSSGLSDAQALGNLVSWLLGARAKQKGVTKEYIAAGLPSLEAWVYRPNEAAVKHKPQ